MDEFYNYWYVRSDGSFEVCCSAYCYDRWCDSALIEGRATRWPLGLAPISLETFCVSCRGCGTLVFQPIHCMVHGEECRNDEWVLSLGATEFVDWFCPGPTFHPGWWDDARAIVSTNPELSGGEVAEKVWRG